MSSRQCAANSPPIEPPIKPQYPPIPPIGVGNCVRKNCHLSIYCTMRSIGGIGGNRRPLAETTPVPDSLQRLNELTELLTEYPDSDPPPIPEEWLKRYGANQQDPAAGREP